MSISVNRGIAHPLQVGIASAFGTPFLGWWLLRGVERELRGDPRGARAALLVAIAWLPAIGAAAATLRWHGDPGMIGAVTLVAGIVQFVVAEHRIGDAARRRPPLQWLVVFRPVAAIQLLVLAIAFGVVVLTSA